MNLTLDEYALFITFLAFINWAVATIIFRRVTVRYIDQKLKEEEDDSADWDSGVGGRIFLYALAIIRKKAQEVSLVNGRLIKKHARKIDIKLAWYSHISTIFLLSLMLIMYFFFDIDAD